MPTPKRDLRTWTKQHGDTIYTCSTDPKLIQVDAFNAALGSDLIWWARSLDPEAARQCVENSLCWGIYVDLPSVEGKEESLSSPGMCVREILGGSCRD